MTSNGMQTHSRHLSDVDVNDVLLSQVTLEACISTAVECKEMLALPFTTMAVRSKQMCMSERGWRSGLPSMYEEGRKNSIYVCCLCM